MRNADCNQSNSGLFGAVISSYSRAQALDDGVLIDAGSMAREAGFTWPVAITSAAWCDCVVWSNSDNLQQVYQDESGRLWDVLYMASQAIRTASGSGDRLHFSLYRVPRNGQSHEAQEVTLKLIVGPGDQGEPVITILLPDED
jgi:hypothetical protein